MTKNINVKTEIIRNAATYTHSSNLFDLIRFLLEKKPQNSTALENECDTCNQLINIKGNYYFFYNFL